jgi:hypothetical protein
MTLETTLDLTVELPLPREGLNQVLQKKRIMNMEKVKQHESLLFTTPLTMLENNQF